MKTRTRNRFALTPERYWGEIFFDPAYMRGLYLEGMRFRTVDVLSHEADPDGRVRRHLRILPRLDAPLLVRKAFRDQMAYEEVGELDPAAGRWRFRVVPSALADRVHVEGEVWLEPAEGGAHDLICDLAFQVDLPAIGPVIEKLIARTYTENADLEAAWLRRWLEEHPAG